MKELTIEAIKEMNGEVITDEQYEALEESEFVEEVEDCGMSGYYVGKHLYCIHLVDEDNIDVCL
nr:MAG TPA: Type III R-M EcoP15I C-terminal domain [Caudoviricetes sp.]